MCTMACVNAAYTGIHSFRARWWHGTHLDELMYLLWRYLCWPNLSLLGGVHMFQHSCPRS